MPLDEDRIKGTAKPNVRFYVNPFPLFEHPLVASKLS
jgi:hypothetical protein